MKKVVYMIAALAFAACGNKTNNAAIQKDLTEDLREDSIARVKFVADSLKKNKNDSLALIAWGDTRFGMTKQQVMKSNAFGAKGREKVSETGYDSFNMEFERRYTFSKQYGLNELNTITAEFSENELYAIRMKSFERTADYIDDLIADCNKLTSQFTKRYGKPWMEEEDVSILSFDNTRSGKLILSAIVVSGHKNTKGIMVELFAKDHMFYYEITIANYDFPKKKHEPTEAELEQQRKEKELNESVKAYSF